MKPLFFCQKCRKDNFSYLFLRAFFKEGLEFHSTPWNEILFVQSTHYEDIFKWFSQKLSNVSSQQFHLSNQRNLNCLFKPFLPKIMYWYNSYVPNCSTRRIFLAAYFSYIWFILYITKYYPIISRILIRKTRENNYYHNRKLRNKKEFLVCRG